MSFTRKWDVSELQPGRFPDDDADPKRMALTERFRQLNPYAATGGERK